MDGGNGCSASKEPAAGAPAAGPAIEPAGAARNQAEAAGQPEGALLHECEREYRKIGWWKGPHAAKEERQAVRRFWVGLGEPGARWLARRIGRETHVDILDGVVNLLASLGPTGVGPILDTLQEDVTPVQAEHLLAALRWARLTGQAPLQSRLHEVLCRFLVHEAADVRQAAVRATRVLPRDLACRLLAERRAAERDPELAEAIAEELAG
jgi:hypothetical protein